MIVVAQEAPPTQSLRIERRIRLTLHWYVEVESTEVYKCLTAINGQFKHHFNEKKHHIHSLLLDNSNRPV